MSKEIVGRTYTVQSVLAKLEGPYTDTVILRSSMTPVISNGKTVGFSNVYTESGLLMAMISIDYATEERLIIETRAKKLYARICAHAHLGGLYSIEQETGAPLINFDVMPAIVQLDIKDVMLCDVPAYKEQIPLGWVG